MAAFASRPWSRRIVDAIRQRDPLTIGGAAGAFDIDWKESVAKRVRRDYLWPKIRRELRVRTAIDSGKRKAEDEKLFAWQMLMPHGIEWIGRADWSQLSPAARGELEQLLRFGIEPLGKTKALAEVRQEAAEPRTALLADDYVVTLQTPALLIDPSRRLARDGSIGSGREQDLTGEFQQVWDELSGGSLNLVNYFQRCALAGGEYFRRRFLRDQPTYRPYLLSLEGSTFLLKPVAGMEHLAQGCLDRWLIGGLPLSGSICRFYGVPDDPKVQWKHCPYLPENGYGEIGVNDDSPYPEATNV